MRVRVWVGVWVRITFLARFVLVGRHLAILVHEVRRLKEVSVVVAERGERCLYGLATLVEAVVQVATTTGDAGLYSLEVALTVGGGNLRE